MSFTALQNSPISINLLTQANETGWTVDGITAIHQNCNAGSIKLSAYTLIPGVSYKISYAILSISGGYVQLFAGATAGVNRTVAGFYTETIVANGSTLSFYSNANCQLQAFNIQNTVSDTSNFQQNTPVYSVSNRKWGEFRTIAPDYGFSLDIDMLTIYQGALYRHQNGSDDRNTFYGVPYQTIIQYVDNSQPEIVQTYMSLSIQSNELMITTPGGITTSLGQVSELAEIDFVKDFLNDGVSQVAVETIEGVYSANLLRDMNTGTLENGDVLRGNYLIITLVSTANTPLRLYTVNIVGEHSSIGSR